MAGPSEKLTRILSIDGGGIRGIIPGMVLTRLERILQERTGNPETRIADHFDLLAGTSTGGILTCMLLCPDPKHKGRPRFSAREAVEMYLDKGGEIFEASLWHRLKSADGVLDEKYPSKPIEKILRHYFGDLKLAGLLKPCLITAYDIKDARTRFFTQHDAKLRPAENYPLWQVARATSAAPSYFEVAKARSMSGLTHPLIDGGVFANNPALCAYAEAREKMEGKPTAARMVIVSLGTGVSKTSLSYSKAKDWGAIEWVKPLIDIMMSGVSETVDYQIRQIFDSVDRGAQYLRINWPLKKKSMREMDNASRGNLKDLERAGNECADSFEKELEAVADLLLND